MKQTISPPSPLPVGLKIGLAILQNCLKLQFFGAQLTYKSYLATLQATTKDSWFLGGQLQDSYNLNIFMEPNRNVYKTIDVLQKACTHQGDPCRIGPYKTFCRDHTRKWYPRCIGYQWKSQFTCLLKAKSTFWATKKLLANSCGRLYFGIFRLQLLPK